MQDFVLPLAVYFLGYVLVQTGNGSVAVPKFGFGLKTTSLGLGGVLTQSCLSVGLGRPGDFPSNNQAINHTVLTGANTDLFYRRWDGHADR